MRCVVLEAATIDFGDVHWGTVFSDCRTTYYDYTSADQMVQRATGYELIVINKLKITAEVLSKVPSCKAIFIAATGYDNVDIAACSQSGIAVYNVSDYSVDSVVQYVLSVILNHTNRLSYYSEQVKADRWSAHRDFCFYDHSIQELSSLKLGILGYGSIGSQVAKSARGLGMQVIASSRSRSTGSDDYVDFVDIEYLFENSDIISLHIPLTNQTKGKINARLLKLMKPNSALINTARGAVVNESELNEFLRTNKTIFAYLDVLSQEPPKSDHPLIGLKNCYLTPHLAWASNQSRQRLIDSIQNNILDFIKGTAQNSLNLDNIGVR